MLMQGLKDIKEEGSLLKDGNKGRQKVIMSMQGSKEMLRMGGKDRHWKERKQVNERLGKKTGEREV